MAADPPKPDPRVIAAYFDDVALEIDAAKRLIGADTGDTWATEIERRLAKIDAGEAKLMSMDDAVARLHRAARSR